MVCAQERVSPCPPPSTSCPRPSAAAVKENARATSSAHKQYTSKSTVKETQTPTSIAHAAAKSHQLLQKPMIGFTHTFYSPGNARNQRVIRSHRSPHFPHSGALSTVSHTHTYNLCNIRGKRVTLSCTAGGAKCKMIKKCKDAQCREQKNTASHSVKT